MKLLLVRHGQTISTNPYQIFGRNEIGLSQKGITDMKQLSTIDCERIICSPLERAMKSAEYISQGNIPIEKDIRLTEIDFGLLGKTDVRESKHIFPDKYRSTLSPHKSFPQGESHYELFTRIQKFHTSLLKKKYSSICVVSHQWALNTYLTMLLNIPLSEKRVFIFEHGVYTLIEIIAGRITFLGHNIQPQKDLDCEIVKKEFNRRALTRIGIDRVLTDRYNPDVNKQFNDTITHLLATNISGPFNNVLEVGVGIGRIMNFFKDKSRSIVGIDFSESMLTIAKKQLREDKNITLIHDDATTINLNDSRFDLGIASLVLKHNSDQNAKKIIKKLQAHCSSILLIEHVRGGSLGSPIAKIRDEQWYRDSLKPFTITVCHRFMRGNDCMVFIIAKR